MITSTDLSRRSFVEGAGATAAAIGMLAGGAGAGRALAADGPAKGDAGSAASAGGDAAAPAVGQYSSIAVSGSAPAWLGEKPQVADADIAKTVDTELLIIGGGNSGVIAARKAAEGGLKVTVMEKMPDETWSPIGCDCGTINSQAYLDAGAERVDEMAVMNEWQLRTYDRSMPFNAKLFATRSGEAMDYVRSVVPQEELDEYSVYYGFPDGRDSVQVNHSGYTSFPGTISYRDFNDTLGNGQNQPAWFRVMRYNIQAAQDAGAQWLWGTKAVVLTQNADGDVTGAIGEDSDGYVKVNASKAVLLCCGDFSGDGSMVLALCDEVRQLAEISGVDTSDPSAFMGMGQDGMGQKLACWAGGAMEPGPRAAMNFGNGMSAPGLTAVGNYPVFGEDGKRFYNDAQLQFGGQGFFARRLPGEHMCTIADGKWAENIRKQGYEHNMSSTTCKREWDLVTEQLDNMTTGPDGFEVYGFTGYGMNTSTMYAADTLDELADILGYEGEAKQGLLDEIEHYNEMCAAGKDTDWGRDADLMYPLDTPPFFGVQTTTQKGRVSSGMVQMSGVLVNDNYQVRRPDDTIIHGLYATGNTAGGRYAVQYHTLLAGNSVGLAVTQGMFIGEHLASSVDQDLADAVAYEQKLAALKEQWASQPQMGPGGPAPAAGDADDAGDSAADAPAAASGEKDAAAKK
ncbi:MAG: FAD-binding protein [Coriobacteriales bacterium]|jgi:hypothetical protein